MLTKLNVNLKVCADFRSIPDSQNITDSIASFTDGQSVVSLTYNLLPGQTEKTFQLYSNNGSYFGFTKEIIKFCNKYLLEERNKNIDREFIIDG